MPIISVSVPNKLLHEIDSSIEERGFASRSEILRQAFRAFKEEYKSLQEYRGKIVTVITIIFDKGSDREKMFDVQHKFGNVVSAFIHSHVDEKYCLEVIVAKGDASVIRTLVNSLKADEQVTQVKLVIFEGM